MNDNVLLQKVTRLQAPNFPKLCTRGYLCECHYKSAYEAFGNTTFNEYLWFS